MPQSPDPPSKDQSDHQRGMEGVEQSKFQLNNTAMNVIAGTVGGIGGVIAGHPLDTLKVRMQTMTFPSITVCLRSLLREEGPTGLFKGMSSPMVGVAAANAFLFGVYGGLLDWQRKWQSRGTKEQPTIDQVFWAGAGSGLANSFISCPTELAKIQLQNQRIVQQFSSPWEVLRHLYQQRGLGGCFRGLGATIWRETPSYAVYFAVFELLSRNPNSDAVSGWQLMMAGGLAGVAGWISTYPADVAKTRIQSQIDPQLEARWYRGTWDCLRHSVRESGVKVLFRGMNATILRAFPTNAAIFLLYRWTMDVMA